MRKAAVFAFACAILANAFPVFADDVSTDDGAPPGVTPATLTLTEVLHRARLAEGTATTQVFTRRDEWKISDGSLSGTRSLIAAGRDFREDETLGPGHTARGRAETKTWQMNENGQVAVGADIHRKDDVDDAAVASPRHAWVTLIGRVDSPASAYVVKVDPPNGRLEYRFYDAKTFLLDRIEQMRQGHRWVITLGDYRATQGVTSAWHVHVSDGHATNDRDETRTVLAIGVPVNPSEVAIPASRPLVHVAGSTSVPVTMSEDELVVPVMLQGRKVDFILDSGSAGIAIDKDVVEALHIQKYGKFTGETAGTYSDSDVILPIMSVGSLTFSDVHAESLPFLTMSQNGIPIAGLLGYDFLRDAVWHIDYVKGTLDAADPGTFVPPAGAHAFPVTFDDFVPTLQATLAEAEVPALIVDTGAGRSALFSNYADRHARAIIDLGLGTQMEASYPFVDTFTGVGGRVETRPIQAGPFAVGPWTFPKWLFDVTQDAPAFEFEDYDGLLGQDFLRNFDVYLDYAHAKIYLVPNDRFKQRWGSRQ